MPQRNRHKKPVNLEKLEKRTLFSSIKLADFGALPNDGIDDRAAIQAAIDSASSHDVIRFDAGTYNLNSPVTVRSGITLKGVEGAKVQMNLGGSDVYGIIVAGNSSDVTIDGLDITSNLGLIRMTDGGAYNDIRITNNSFSNGGGKYGIFGTVTNNRLQIEHNYFHDSQDQLRCMEVWRMNDSSYSYNRFHNVEDGGHIMDPGPNVRFSYNHGTMIHRMGIEVQDSGFRTRPDRANFIAEGNVFYDWFEPYWDSMGMSIPITSPLGGSTIVRNYIRQNAVNGQWGESDGNVVRGSFGIELGMEAAGKCEENVIGGERMVGHIVVMENDIPVKNNQLYGHAGWGGHIFGEPNSHGGHGTFIEENNIRNENLGDMPLAQSVDWASLSMSVAGPGKHDVGGKPIAEPDEPADPRPVDESSSEFDYLSDLDWVYGVNGWGPIEKDRSNGHRWAEDGQMLTLGGKKYHKGLGVAVNSELIYDLNDDYSTFTSDVGVDDAVSHKGSMTFEVWGDGEKLYDSGLMVGESETKRLSVDVTGVSELKLVTTDGGDGANR
ncbi:MAG: NPCBM/NEW2 domain-containing protein, partial [Tepidisphaeraceae bacterium]